ncbi:MAG: 30S ribosomal protein S12 methylthiotransferase RimO [Endomicrobiales bacterium]|nr:30S ribosomal protein S12 methylthiotransferase RimO [Endomicrobiales bacterium]
MKKLSLIILGCPKNVVEGENMAGLLKDAGWSFTADVNEADCAVVHTCSFIRDAQRESEAAIRRLCGLKKRGGLKKLIVTGCHVQSNSESLIDKYPEVDGFLGTGSLEMINEIAGRGVSCLVTEPGGFLETLPGKGRLLSSALPSAYLRVSEGCDHRCGFCVIPRMRGGYRSRKKENIVLEARELAERGVREFILIAQDTTSYGRDIYGFFALSKLLKDLCRVDGVKWIRLMYGYPGSVTDELLDVIAGEDRICKYIDLPLQHVSEKVLKLMKRPAGARQTARRVKSRVPGVFLRTSLITGFPGEGKREFEELLGFVSEGWFDHMGVFEYSDVEGAASCSLINKIKKNTAVSRKKALMLEQQRVVKIKNGKLVGKTAEVLLEKGLGGGRFRGRAWFQSPEVDGSVFLKAKTGSREGDFVKTTIEGFSGYDLKGAQR